MDLQEEQKPITTSCLINDENNNFRSSTCTNCECKNHLEEKKNERMMIIPDISSDDEYWCSSCSSVNDSELISLDTRQLWHDIAHIIKCVYRETNREFAENHSTTDICKAKEYVQILTQSNPECLFNKIESIVLEYVDEIRNQVLKRFQTCLKTSNDVQLFISYLLDEYNTFIQAAKNVSTIVSYLEEHYMKSFHLTWLLYNKHLYEKLVYMDKKIQHSMSTMIDLLQPSNDNNNDYSPAEYAQLLNRFLAFDEEMSEISCLYKDCQTKMTSISKNSLIKNRNQTGIIKTKKKNICKKTKTIRNTQGLTKENFNSSTTNAVNIPISNNSSIIPTTSQQDSNGSSISSGTGGKESSSISSFDEYLLDNNPSSSNYTKEESDDLIQNNNPSIIETQQKLDENIITDNNQQQQQISTVSSTKKSKSNRRKESLSSLPKTCLTPDLILPPKPPSSTGSKLQADFRPLTIPLLTKTEIPTCPSLLSAKIQSVSFTAGTFGSITTNESTSLSSINQKRLNLNLSRKTDSTIACNNLDQLLRQAGSSDEISALLSSLEFPKSTDDIQKSSLSDKNCDFCCCDLFSESNSSTTSSCLTCMSLPNSTTITCAFNPREIERKERLKLKLTKRTVQNISDESKSSTGNKSKIKPSDNNIDDLVRFIDGNETISDQPTRKKNKKKKDKKQEETNQTKSTSNNSQTLPKRKQKTKLKIQQQEKQIEETSIIKPSTPPPPPPPPAPVSMEINPEPSSENSIPPEEEINWITISRKQTKHKPSVTSTPSLPSVLVLPPNKTKQKQNKNKTQSLAQQKVIQETVPNSNKQQQQHTSNIPSIRVQNPVKQQQSPSAWTNNHEQTPVTPSSNLVATAPVFIPSSSRSIPNKTNDILPLEQSSSAPYWDPNGYLLPPGPVQRPFSPAPQRPSPERRTNTFSSYSPMNYTVNNSTSTWNDTPITNSNQSQWKYPYEEQLPTSTIPNDFPLYDPFNSGAGLTLITNGLEENLGDLHISKDNDIDEMDALDKEIQDFKKSYIDNIPLDSHFIQQS